MSRWLRLSTAQTERIGPFLDETDGVTPVTGLTPVTELSKDGAAFATGPTGTHDTEGWYSVAFTTTHTNALGSLMVQAQDAANHLPVWHEFMVLPAVVYDALVLGTDELDVNVAEWLDTAVPAPGTAGVPSVDVLRWDTDLVATPTIAGVPEVDLTHIGGDPTSLTDFKDFVDAGYDPITNKVQGVVLVDTTDVNTDMVAEAPTAADNADAVWDENIVAAHGGANAAGLILSELTKRSVTFATAVVSGSIFDQLADDGTEVYSRVTDSLQAIRDQGDAAWTTGGGTGLSALSTGVAQAGGVTSITLAAGDSATDNIYEGSRVLVTGGTAVGQSRVITAYDGTTKIATVARAWTTNPVISDTYEIQAAEANLETIQTDEVSVTDLKDFADAGYDPGANKVQGVVLVDTTAVNSDMRGTELAALATVCTPARLGELDPANLPSDVDDILADTGDMQPKLGIPVADLATDIAAVKTEADKIALTDAGAGVLGSVIEEVENVLADTADMQPKLGSPVADISADIAAVKTEADKIALADAGAGVVGSVIEEVENILADTGTDGVVLAANSVDATAVANGAIDAATFAAGAIDAAAIATDAVNKIAAGIGPQQNQAFSDLEFLMVLSSDGQTPATGLTVTGQRSIDGAAFAGVSGTITEVGGAVGIYQFDALSADMNGAVITFRFSSATALDTFITIKTTP